MTAMASQELRSGDQTLRFDGEPLSRASSEHGYRGERKPRWTEITIYRTDDGKYVVSKIGKSRVVHAHMRCHVLRNNEDPLELVTVAPGHQPCERCFRQPQETGYLENDHATVSVADRPEGAVAACYSRDGNGLWSLSWLAEDALRDAFERDRDLEAAFLDFDIGSLGRRSR